MNEPFFAPRTAKTAMPPLKGQITIFSIVGCPFCIRAKGKMEELGLAFIDINLDKNKEARKVMIDRTSKKTVPQIFFNNYHVGGWTELKNLVSVAKVNILYFLMIWFINR